MSEEKPSELGTGDGAEESLELTLSPSEPEHSFASFTLKNMKKKKDVFLGSCKNFHQFVMPLPVELLHLKEKQPTDSELGKLSLLPEYFVFPSDSQITQLKQPKSEQTNSLEGFSGFRVLFWVCLFELQIHILLRFLTVSDLEFSH